MTEENQHRVRIDHRVARQDPAEIRYEQLHLIRCRGVSEAVYLFDAAPDETREIDDGLSRDRLVWDDNEGLIGAAELGGPKTDVLHRAGVVSDLHSFAQFERLVDRHDDRA